MPDSANGFIFEKWNYIIVDRRFISGESFRFNCKTVKPFSVAYIRGAGLKLNKTGPKLNAFIISPPHFSTFIMYKVSYCQFSVWNVTLLIN